MQSQDTDCRVEAITENEESLLRIKALTVATKFGLFPNRTIFAKGVHPQNAFIIDVSEDEIDASEDKKIGNVMPELISEGSIATIESRLIEKDDFGDHEKGDEFVGLVRWVVLYIRQSTTNTQFRTVFMGEAGRILERYKALLNDDYDWDCEDDEYDDFSREENEKEILRVGVIIAKSKGFGDLKNNDQWYMFIKDMCKDGKCWEEWKFHIGRISSAAEYMYENGVLYPICKELQEEGLTSNAIAKKVGKTKNRVEKVLKLSPPDFVLEAFADAAQTDSEP